MVYNFFILFINLFVKGWKVDALEVLTIAIVAEVVMVAY